MKWLFLLNDAQFLSEFLGKLSQEVMKKQDTCLVVCNSKIAEYGKKKFFLEGVEFVSKIDWCIENYDSKKTNFGGLSWKEMFPVFERFKKFKMSYREAVEIASHLFQFFECIFEKEKPDIVIGEAPADIFHETAYYFCKNKGISYLSLEESKFDKKIDIYNLRHICSKYEEDFLKIKDEEISLQEKDFSEKFVQGFISHKILPGHTDFRGIHFSQLGIVTHYIERLKQFGVILLKYVVKRSHFKKFDYESETIIKNGIKSPFETEIRQVKIFLQRNIFSKLKNNNGDFFFFPLHFQPESSTSVYATYYYDQLNTIRNVAFCLPMPYKLYVKEHPASVGLRQDIFYKKLKDIPNVVLLSPYENVQEIIEKSSGVIVLTGTIGMESALLGKPTYVLGTTLYYHHPLCRKIKGFTDLKEMIEKDLSQKIEVEDIKEINNRFIISYFRNTIDGSVVSASLGKDINDYGFIYNKLKEFSCH